MSGVKVFELNKENPYIEQYLDQVENLFVQLFDYMKTVGLVTPLIKGGEKLWRDSLEKTIGKMSVLIIAEKDKEVMGFAHGILRFAPNFLGEYKIGFVPHVYVSSKVRAKGVGENLYLKLEEWFKQKDVKVYELQVLCGNSGAINFWEKMGYIKNIVQMYKSK